MQHFILSLGNMTTGLEEEEDLNTKTADLQVPNALDQEADMTKDHTGTIDPDLDEDTTTETTGTNGLDLEVDMKTGTPTTSVATGLMVVEVKVDREKTGTEVKVVRDRTTFTINQKVLEEM